jgi:hypothetical protein
MTVSHTRQFGCQYVLIRCMQQSIEHYCSLHECSS